MTTIDAQTTLAADAADWLAGRRTRVDAAQLAAGLRMIADRLATLGTLTGSDLSLWAGLDIQPEGHRNVDVVAVAFGVEAETKLMGNTYHRKAQAGPVSIYTSCPPPVEVQREQLLAQLADLDAQAAAEASRSQDDAQAGVS